MEALDQRTRGPDKNVATVISIMHLVKQMAGTVKRIRQSPSGRNVLDEIEMQVDFM